MSEGSLKYLEKSDFGGLRSRKGKRKPNQLYVCDITTQWLDFPRGLHFNKLPVQLIMEIFKYLSAYELLRNVSLVCKYWYNLCRDRTLWTSITWNGTQRTLGDLLQLTKYQVHELVLTDNVCNFSDMVLACLLKKCIHLKCLKLPTDAYRELFKRELPRTKIVGGIPGGCNSFSFFEGLFANIEDALFANIEDDWFPIIPNDWHLATPNVMKYRSQTCFRFHSLLDDDWSSSGLDGSILAQIYEKEIEIALSSVEHKRYLTPEEFLGKHRKAYIFSQHPDIYFPIELDKLECLLQRDYVSRSARIYEKVTKSPRQSCIRNIPFQDCRMDRRQHQPSKIKPRPPKGRSNQHKEVRKFRRLQKRFKVFSLK